MSDKVYLGKNAVQMDTSPAFDAYSKVVVIVGEDEDGNQQIYEAGDDTGLTLEITNPWGTQEIADSILARIGGYSYQPFTASGALLDPAAELGDAITANGTYSVLAAQNIRFGSLTSSDIAAPGGGEIEHEYPYESSEMKQIARRIAKTNVSLTVGLKGVTAKVESLETNVTSELSVMSGEIAARVTNSEAQTMIAQNLNTITLSAVGSENQSTVTISANGIVVDSAVVKFSNIVADEIVTNISITSPNIYGGTFYNSPGGAYMTIGDGASNYYGDFGVYSATGRAAFNVYDGIDNIHLQLSGYTFIRDGAIKNNFYPQGNWNFAGAKISYIVLDSSMYGSTLPASGVTGQLFFKI